MVGEPNEAIQGYRHPFLNGSQYLDGVGDKPRTRTDLALSLLSASLRRKRNWWESYHDPGTRALWAEEARARKWTVHTSINAYDEEISDHQIEYVLDELEGYDKLRDLVHGCQVSCFERIWESDASLDASSLTRLNDELSSISSQLSPASASQHAQVSLIDPFRNPLIYDKTLVRPAEHPDQQAEHMPAPISENCDTRIAHAIAQSYALLPTPFSIDAAGRATARSYISDLHPAHTALYTLLAQLLSSCVPLFEHVLTDLHRRNALPQRIRGVARYSEWNEPESPVHSDDERSWAAYESERRRWVMSRPIDLPDVPARGYLGGLEERRHRVRLRGRSLLVITEVFEIRLVPNSSRCPASEWTVSGAKNENVVAVAYYVASTENLHGGALEFRMAVTSQRRFFEDDAGATLRTWGMASGDPCHQTIGSAPVPPGRCVAFPNIYQHRRGALALVDPARAGRQRVVVVALVDPDLPPVVSTARVPQQRARWVSAALYAAGRFPAELCDQIVGEMDNVLTERDVEDHRMLMRNERAAVGVSVDAYHFRVPF
ncbi:hypothetical protein CONPUDRAFT_116344 [Coniophora puteana RWD-64-598 SS2]|uniref:DUF4246 domain-containing protein n=1 Tax=Coniophora puteana (strain RWD-64-598) TaxID=741705 RepID=A0A5M3N8N6_CONPW|nr:uncharacterized protein CONPUDRAFT_116344 [Coniophora puteana RWD-64-598 SS2]EIW87205.1 hypothetical protein CONPUDRAFT_116344 [Coniophora puteana RWD-64-598 SS2]